MRFAFRVASRSRAAFAGALCCAWLLMLCAAPPPALAQEEASTGEEERGTYVVKKGDTLYGISRRHGLSVAQLRRLNPELEGSRIFPGQELRVRASQQDMPAEGAPAETEGEDPPQPEAPPPDTAAPDAIAPDTAAPDTAAPDTAAPPDSNGAAPPGPSFYGSHTVEAGATLYTIAARYGTTVDSLVALNDSMSATMPTFLEAGQAVRLPASLGPPAHTVKAGETIYDLAERYKVSAMLIQRTNDLEQKAVQEGQRLRIPGQEAPAPQPKGTRRPASERGPVARYPASYEGRLMAGGARYDPGRYVASHPSLPIGTVVLLTNPATGQQTFAEVADRGPLEEQFVMDVSTLVHERLGLAEGSTQPVDVRVMN